MTPLRILIVAGETSGDILAAELINRLRQQCASPDETALPIHPQPAENPNPRFSPEFFGAGGPKMAAAGAEVAFDLTGHAVVGLWEVIRKYRFFKSVFRSLLDTALTQRPDAVVLVDFSGFNRRLARVLRKRIRANPETFGDWQPKLIYYVSPQVWASRPGRAHSLARDLDLLISIFPFEKRWYARHAPSLRVEFVGHPILDRYPDFPPLSNVPQPSPPLVLLLPGSRANELKRHLPVLVEAARQIQAQTSAEFRMILPNADLVQAVTPLLPVDPRIAVQSTGLPEALACATIAIASTGTVTMECAYFGVPTVALYKTSWSTYQIGKRIITVNYLTMPDLLVGEAVFPEWIQNEATPEHVAESALALLRSEEKRNAIKTKLAGLVQMLGPAGAADRAAALILNLFESES